MTPHQFSDLPHVFYERYDESADFALLRAWCVAESHCNRYQLSAALGWMTGRFRSLLHKATV